MRGRRAEGCRGPPSAGARRRPARLAAWRSVLQPPRPTRCVSLVMMVQRLLGSAKQAAPRPAPCTRVVGTVLSLHALGLRTDRVLWTLLRRFEQSARCRPAALLLAYREFGDVCALQSDSLV